MLRFFEASLALLLAVPLYLNILLLRGRLPTTPLDDDRMRRAGDH